MQRKRFAETQIMPLVGKQEERGPTADFYRERGLANFFKVKLRPLPPLMPACALLIFFVNTIRRSGAAPKR